MTVAAIAPIISYIEDGATLAFSVPFRFLAGSDLVVSRTVAGVETTLTYPAQWSAVGGASDAGGTVTLGTSVAGATLVIRRQTPLAQQTDYTATDRFPAESHERALDRAMLIAQEQDREVDSLSQALSGVLADPQLLSLQFATAGGWYDTAAAGIVDTDPGEGFFVQTADGRFFSVLNDGALGRIGAEFLTAAWAQGGSTVQAIEDLAAGAWVHIYDAAGVARVCNATAADPDKPANGFVLAVVASGAVAKVYRFGPNSAVTVPGIVAPLYLSDTVPGGHSTSPPTAAGHLVQQLGIAVPGSGVFFQPQLVAVL